MPALLFRRASGALLAGLALLLGGCNDSNENPNTSLIGTAAVGAPLAGASIDLRCSDGTSISTVTDGGGAWSVSLASSQLPCAVRAAGGTVDGSANMQTLYSLTVGTGHNLVVNVTPLTTLVLADAANAAPSDTWFYSLDASALQTLAASLSAAIAALVDALQELGYALPSDDFNPFTLAFVAESGNTYDFLLEQLKAVLAYNGSSLNTVTGYMNAGTSASGVYLDHISLSSDGGDLSTGDIYLSGISIGSGGPITGH